MFHVTRKKGFEDTAYIYQTSEGSSEWKEHQTIYHIIMPRLKFQIIPHFLLKI